MPADQATPAERLDRDMKDAMRSGDRVRLGAIRRARAALKNAEIEAGGPLDEEAQTRVLRGVVKRHRESIEQFRAGGREDLVEGERREMEAIEEYLPASLDEAAIAAIVDEAIAEEGAEGPRDLGRVMKAAMGRVAGRADGGEVRSIAQRRLEDGR